MSLLSGEQQLHSWKLELMFSIRALHTAPVPSITSKVFSGVNFYILAH